MSAEYAYSKPQKLGSVQPVSPQVRRHATRQVAMLATNAEDCAMLLDMLGLDAAEGKTRRRVA